MSQKLRKLNVTFILVVVILLAFSGITFAYDSHSPYDGDYIEYNFDDLELTMFFPNNYMHFPFGEEDIGEIDEELVKKMGADMFFEMSGDFVITLEYIVYREGILPFGYFPVEDELNYLAEEHIEYGFQLEPISYLEEFNTSVRDSGYVICAAMTEDFEGILIIGCALGEDYWSSIIFLLTYDYFFDNIEEVESILVQFLFTDEIEVEEYFMAENVLSYLGY